MLVSTPTSTSRRKSFIGEPSFRAAHARIVYPARRGKSIPHPSAAPAQTPGAWPPRPAMRCRARRPQRISVGIPDGNPSAPPMSAPEGCPPGCGRAVQIDGGARVPRGVRTAAGDEDGGRPSLDRGQPWPVSVQESPASRENRRPPDKPANAPFGWLGCNAIRKIR